MKRFIFTICFFSFFGLFAQDDLLSELDDLTAEDDKTTTEYTYGTFKGTRVINSQSVELTSKGELTLLISHRFGTVNEGPYSLWGLDNASMRLGFEYGVTDFLTISYGRSSFNKTYDGFYKLKLLRQSKGAKKMPISAVLYSGLAINTIEKSTATKDIKFSSRLSYYNQLIIGRKFNSKISLQLMPTHIHRNVVKTKLDENDLFALGTAGRVKLSSRFALTGEYLALLSDYNGINNSLSLGIEIETGGHVFQLQFTNSQGMTDNYFVGETQGTWGNGDIYFGFNISRGFRIVDYSKKKKEKE